MFLQLPRIYKNIFDHILLENPSLKKWTTLEELEEKVNSLFAEAELELRKPKFPPKNMQELLRPLDNLIWTKESEHFDDPDFPEEKKQQMVNALNDFNKMALSYRKFFSALRPLIKEIGEKEGRPVRFLELASGSGKFLFELEKLSAKNGLQIEITGSDYIPKYIQTGNELSKKQGSSVKFKEINALQLDNYPEDAFDIVFIAQSIHHFTPGQLARMIAGADKIAKYYFVGIDGYRSLVNFFLAPTQGLIISLLNRDPKFDYFHDAFVTGRKFFNHTQLKYIADIASNEKKTEVSSLIGHSVLKIDLQ